MKPGQRTKNRTFSGPNLGAKAGNTPAKKTDDLSKWINRNQAADLLNVTLNTLQNLERRGKLHPRRALRIDASGAERQMYVYDPAELATIPRHIRTQIRSPGEVAARTFEMLDEGKSIREIVIELREAPDLIEQYKESWQEHGGADRVINPAAWDRIAAMVGPFSSVAQLVERIEKITGFTSGVGHGDVESEPPP